MTRFSFAADDGGIRPGAPELPDSRGRCPSPTTIATPPVPVAETYRAGDVVRLARDLRTSRGRLRAGRLFMVICSDAADATWAEVTVTPASQPGARPWALPRTALRYVRTMSAAELAASSAEVRRAVVLAREAAASSD